MPRPPLPVGTFGKIDFLDVAPGRVRARVRFRDYDGVIRPVTKFGPSKAAAERALREALRDRQGPTGGEIRSDSKVSALIDAWLDEIAGRNIAPQTRDHYRYAADHYLAPGLRNLRVREVQVPAVDQLLRTLRQTRGPGAAKLARTVLSGVLDLAVRHGALRSNPVRDAAKAPQTPRKQARALTVEEATDLMTKLRADHTAVDLDLVDLCEFMLGTGVRLGEACAVRAPAVDLDAGEVEINATVVRVKGAGAVIQEWPKTAAGRRVLALPPHIVALARCRIEKGDRTLLASPLGHVRDVSNTTGDLRRAFDRAGYDWVTSHTFRKTVATRLDEAGLSARQIADHLGHASPSLTQDVYMGRKAATLRAAEVLA